MKQACADSVGTGRSDTIRKPSAYEVFSRAERIELAAAALYRRVAARFPWSVAERRVFEALEREEIQHAARVRLLTSQYRNDSRLFHVQELDLRVLDAVEDAVQAVVAEVDSGRWDGDSEGLKARIVEMEERAGASHADVLADCADARVAWLFDELSKQDGEHHALLLGLMGPAAQG
jgi:rubrerythrin